MTVLNGELLVVIERMGAKLQNSKWLALGDAPTTRAKRIANPRVGWVHVAGFRTAQETVSEDQPNGS